MDSKIEPVANDIAIAPKDGTMLRLLVEYDHSDLASAPLEDAEGPTWTIGFNNLANTGEDVWEIVGWDWEQDCFRNSAGRPVGWLPFHTIDGALPRRDSNIEPVAWRSPINPFGQPAWEYADTEAALIDKGRHDRRRLYDEVSVNAALLAAEQRGRESKRELAAQKADESAKSAMSRLEEVADKQSVPARDFLCIATTSATLAAAIRKGE